MDIALLSPKASKSDHEHAPGITFTGMLGSDTSKTFSEVFGSEDQSNSPKPEISPGPSKTNGGRVSVAGTKDGVSDTATGGQPSPAKQYLRTVLGPALANCMTELCLQRPEDPIDFMARWLYRYVDFVHYAQEKASFIQRATTVAETLHRKRKSRRERLHSLKTKYAEFMQILQELAPRQATKLSGKNRDRETTSDSTHDDQLMATTSELARGVLGSVLRWGKMSRMKSLYGSKIIPRQVFFDGTSTVSSKKDSSHLSGISSKLKGMRKKINEYGEDGRIKDDEYDRDSKEDIYEYDEYGEYEGDSGREDYGYEGGSKKRIGEHGRGGRKKPNERDRGRRRTRNEYRDGISRLLIDDYDGDSSEDGIEYASREGEYEDGQREYQEGEDADDTGLCFKGAKEIARRSSQRKLIKRRSQQRLYLGAQDSTSRTLQIKRSRTNSTYAHWNYEYPPGRIVCKHPVLGKLAARRQSRRIKDIESWYVENGECQSLYDHEMYMCLPEEMLYVTQEHVGSEQVSELTREEAIGLLEAGKSSSMEVGGSEWRTDTQMSKGMNNSNVGGEELSEERGNVESRDRRGSKISFASGSARASLQDPVLHREGVGIDAGRAYTDEDHEREEDDNVRWQTDMQ